MRHIADSCVRGVYRVGEYYANPHGCDMPMTSICPGCFKPIQLPDGGYGKRVRCGACQHVFVIEAPPVESLPIAVEPTPTTGNEDASFSEKPIKVAPKKPTKTQLSVTKSEPPRRALDRDEQDQRKSASRSAVMIGLLFLFLFGGLFVCIAGIGVWFLFPGGVEKKQVVGVKIKPVPEKRGDAERPKFDGPFIEPKELAKEVDPPFIIDGKNRPPFVDIFPKNIDKDQFARDLKPVERLTRSKLIQIQRVSPTRHPGLTAVAYSRDGNLALSGGRDWIARLWDINEGKRIRQFIGHTSVIWSVALSPDGKTAFTGSEDHTAVLWDVETGEKLHTFATKGIISCARFSPDGKLAAATCWDNKVRFWHVETGKLAGEISFKTPVLDIAFSSDGTRFLLGNIDGIPRIGDIGSDKTQEFLPGHNKDKGKPWVHGVALSNDGKRALSAGHDWKIRLWDVPSRKELKVFAGHTNIVHEVRFLPGDRYFLSASQDGTIRLWDSVEGVTLCIGDHIQEVRALAISKDGTSALTGCSDGAIRVWQILLLQAK